MTRYLGMSKIGQILMEEISHRASLRELNSMSVSSQKISLEQIDSICASLGGLMQVLMDQNAMALIVGSTGEVTFTKQGTKVVSEANHTHPIEKLIINAANKYHMKTGDDCKLFLILLKEMMHGVKRMLTKYDEIYVRRTLSLEVGSLMSFIPHLYESIRSISTVSNPSDGFESFSEALDGIVRTFIDSRFPCLVSKDLSRLIYRFLVDSISDWGKVDALDYLISHFDIFCSKAPLPLHKSCIMKGFLLHQRFISSLEGRGNLKFVMIWDVSQKSDEVCWSVQVDSLPLQLSHLWKRIEKSLTTIKCLGVSVILTPSTACENFKSLCSQCEITLIDCIASEDVVNIVYFTAILPMNTLNETLEPSNIAHIKSIKSVAFEKFHYTHLEILANRNSIVLNHVVLCALTDSFWKEYYTEFFNCLKVVKQWLNPSVNLFYKRQYETKQVNTVIENDNMLCNVEERLKAKCDFLQRSDFCSKTLYAICPDNSKLCSLGLSFPLGLWEFAFKVVLTKVSSCKQSFPNLCHILECALLQTVCQMWNISLRNYEGQKSYSAFYKKVKSKLVTPVVPVLSKEDQLLEVLQLLLQLLKIDAIVGSK